MRRLVWFSCGAASAVAAKLTVDKHPGARVLYCDTSASEHPDNARFLTDVERWLGIRVTKLRSEKFSSIDGVFETTRYMAGIAGARCTVELKKVPRFAYQRVDDVHIFGLTADEGKRRVTFEKNNPELYLEWPLFDAGLTKDDCLRTITEAGIELPTMYRLGYRNNNCIGCVKATSAVYWDKVRTDFPEHFARRAAQSRALNVRLVRVAGQRRFLDELPVGPFRGRQENVSCGPECGAK